MIQKGKIIKGEDGKWYVEYHKVEYTQPIHKPGVFGVTHKEFTTDILPLHPDDVHQINLDGERFDNIEARILAAPDVEFEIVSDKTAYIYKTKQGFDYIINNYAKLIKI